MNTGITQQIEQEFAYVDSLIAAHTNAAIAKVNAESLQTYWEVGEYISHHLKTSEWGDHIVSELADYLKRKNPQRRGYSKRNLYNMVRFYDVYSSPDYLSLIEQLKLSEFVQLTTAQISANQIVQLPTADRAEVEYSINRTMSPTMVAEYKRILVPREVMKKSLAEYCAFLKEQYK